MQQIKIFEDYSRIEEDINWWIECNPSYKIINVNMCPLYDIFPNGDVRNQWISIAVIYDDGR